MRQTVAETTGLDAVTIKALLAFGMLLNSGAALQAAELDEPWATGCSQTLTCVVTVRDRFGDGCRHVGRRAAGVLPPGRDGPAMVRRDGTALAGPWLPDLVRLGELERHLGGGVIEAVVDAELGKRRRIMSYSLVIRLMIAMTLMPDASYGEALARLAGLLADVPFARDWRVPTRKVITKWRLLI
jgi:hypothetical protein